MSKRKNSKKNNSRYSQKKEEPGRFKRMIEMVTLPILIVVALVMAAIGAIQAIEKGDVCGVNYLGQDVNAWAALGMVILGAICFVFLLGYLWYRKRHPVKEPEQCKRRNTKVRPSK